MRTVPAFPLAVFLICGVALAPAGAAPPQSGAGQPTPPSSLRTGFDLAVSDIGTTGSQAPCVNCPVVTVKNLGTKAVNGTYQVKYVCNGTVVYPFRDIVLNIAPGQTQKIEPHNPLDHNFARYGDTVQAMIDVDNRLREDNEANNTFQKKLLLMQQLRQPADTTGNKFVDPAKIRGFNPQPEPPARSNVNPPPDDGKSVPPPDDDKPVLPVLR